MTGVKPTDTGPLWAGLLAGPVAWAVQLQAVYAAASWECDGGPAALLHVLSAACLLGAAGGGWVAWRAWRAVRGWPSGTDEPAAGRSRLMAVLGLMSTALFAVVILAQWLAVTILSCGSKVPT